MAAVGVGVSAEAAVTAVQGPLPPGEDVMLIIRKGGQEVPVKKAQWLRGAVLLLKQGSSVLLLIEMSPERKVLLLLEPGWRQSKTVTIVRAQRRQAVALSVLQLGGTTRVLMKQMAAIAVPALERTEALLRTMIQFALLEAASLRDDTSNKYLKCETVTLNAVGIYLCIDFALHFCVVYF